VTPI